MFALRFWIWLNAVLVAGGWLLSTGRWLNGAGYVVLLVIILAGGWWLRPARWRAWPLSRFRRPLPGLFLLLVILSFFSGAGARPEFTDGLAYRTPRVAHWLRVEGWEWIRTEDDRKNNRGAGFEWVTAPVLLGTKTDRTIFLINLVSLCLLPGVTFAFLRGEKVRPRVAWKWAWLLSAGTGFALQASSIASDLHGVPLLLGAFVLARRAARTGSAADLALSLLAVLLPSAAKPFNILFVLPWAAALYPAWPAVWRHKWRLVAVLPLAALCSLLPTAFLNVRYTGDWTGLQKTASGVHELAPVSPAIGLLGNACLLTAHNLIPPMLPGLAALQPALGRLAATPTGEKLNASFEGIFFEIPGGESAPTAGLGLALTALLAASALRRTSPRPDIPRSVTLVSLGVAAALLVFMAKAGAHQAARLALPFYIPLAAIVLRHFSTDHARAGRGWRVAAAAVMLYPSLLLLMAKGGPLLPWETGLRLMARLQPEKPLWQRGLAAMEAHHQRADLFAGLREALPPGETEVGLVARLVKEATLWLPIGSRTIRNITSQDTLADARARGLRYVILPAATTTALPPALRVTRDLFENAGTVVYRHKIPATLSQGEEEWLLVRLPDDAGAPATLSR